MNELNKIHLTPHHVVKLVDACSTGEDTTPPTEYQTLLGPWLKDRVDAAREVLSKFPDFEVTIVRDTRQDFICHGNPQFPRVCSYTTQELSNCYTEGKARIEDSIAADMGVKYGSDYSFSDLVSRRLRTSYNT